MINDKEIVNLLKEGYDTAPRMARHVLSLPAEGSIRPLGYDIYNRYALTVKSIFRRLSVLARFGIVRRIGMEDKAMVWGVAE